MKHMSYEGAILNEEARALAVQIVEFLQKAPRSTDDVNDMAKLYCAALAYVLAAFTSEFEPGFLGLILALVAATDQSYREGKK